MARAPVELKKRDIEHRSSFSELQKERLASKCIKPRVVLGDSVRVEEKEALGAKDHHERIEALFPNTYGKPRVELLEGTESDKCTSPFTIGVVLSGGQAPGGHNVIAGIFDFARRCSSESRVIGFLDGPHGVMNGIYIEITPEIMDLYRNTGGFDMLGSGRHKIHTVEQMEDSLSVCTQLGLEGLIVIGGDDSNTNAALLAEFFSQRGSSVKVCGCPKTIDGDLKNEYIPISFGFDTAIKTFSEEVGNVALDTLSTQKYYHFVRVMGRGASSIALECSLQCRPNMCLISEEVEAKHMSLMKITDDIADMIVKRSSSGKNYGVIVIPEGLIEFIPEFNKLIAEINDVLAAGTDPTEEAVVNKLSVESRGVFLYMPPAIKLQLLLDRDPHGNVQLAKIETERLLAMTVESELTRRRIGGEYSGAYEPQFHSFGYEGRCAVPSHFDCSYCYTLGYTAACLIAKGLNSLMASVQNLDLPIENWTIGGVPITMMCHIERRHGKDKPVIKKALVELSGDRSAPFMAFAAQRESWMFNDLYRAPGPIQFSGPGARDTNMTLMYELMGQEKGGDATGCNLKPDAVPQPKSFGSKEFLFRPASVAVRSNLEKARLSYTPKVPPSLTAQSVTGVSISLDDVTQCSRAVDREPISRLFPLTYGSKLVQMDKGDMSGEGVSSDAPAIKVGVVFCGRQSAGGHNVVWGLHSFLKGNPKSKLVGFVGGTLGLFEQTAVDITDELLEGYKNQGGYDLLGRTVDAIRSEEQVSLASKACTNLALDGLVVIGGTTTHTDAAYLAEAFLEQGVKTKVVGVPCSISGGMKNEFVEAAVGTDTAVKIYSQLVGNTAIDGASARKYWYFMRLMGQDPSHIALEVALQTHPNAVLLTEQVMARGWSLRDVVRHIADVVVARSETNKNFGTILVPEGLLKAIPEIKVLIDEIDTIYVEHCGVGGSGAPPPPPPSPKSGGGVAPAVTTPSTSRGGVLEALSVAEVSKLLTSWSAALLASLPEFIQVELCLARQSNKKVRLSQVQTEKMLAHFVEAELAKRKEKGQYKGSFSAVCSFLGYQARSALPSNFDCDYGFTLGGAAAVLLHRGCTGYLAMVTGLSEPVKNWKVGGVPLTALLVADAEARSEQGHVRPHVPSGKVNLHGPAMQRLQELLTTCEKEDRYRNPGPVQYEGSTVESRLVTMSLETSDYLGQLQRLRAALTHIRESCRPGCSSKLLKLSTLTLQGLTELMALQNSS